MFKKSNHVKNLRFASLLIVSSLLGASTGQAMIKAEAGDQGDKKVAQLARNFDQMEIDPQAALTSEQDYQQALNHLKAENFGLARDLLNLAAKKGHKKAIYELGVIAFKRGNHDEALKCFMQGDDELSKTEAYAIVSMKRNDALAKGKYVDALQYQKQMSELNKSSANFYQLGTMYRKGGTGVQPNPQEAYLAFQNAIQHYDPTQSPDASSNNGQKQIMIKAVEAAILMITGNEVKVDNPHDAIASFGNIRQAYAPKPTDNPLSDEESEGELSDKESDEE